jgi:hypothetical protein
LPLATLNPMTAIAAKNVDAFLAKPNPAQPVVLV